MKDEGRRQWNTGDQMENMKPPLIDRKNEQRTIAQQIAALEDERGSCIYLTGESGVGKTHLVEHCLDQTNITKLVLPVKCRFEQPPKPFHPFHRAIRTYLAMVEESEQKRAEAQLPQAIFGMHQHEGYHPPIRLPHSTADQQIQIFDALSTFFTTAAREQPILLILDDLQWIDSSSFAFLQYLIPQLATQRILIILAYRSTDPEQRADERLQRQIVSFFKQLCHRRDDILECITLERFDQKRTEALLTYLTKREQLPEQFLQWIYFRSKGNPLFIVELYRELRSRFIDIDAFDWTDPQATQEIPTPRSIREVVSQRVEALDDKARTAVSYAAIIGNEFDRRVVGEACETSKTECELSQSMERVANRGLIRKERPFVYRFDQPVVREVVYDHLSEERRSELHRIVGRVLETAADTKRDNIDLARHFYHGGVQPKAHTYAIQAARDCRRLGAFFEAAQYYQWALETVETDHADRDTAVTRAELHQQIASTYTLAGKWKTAEKHYWLALEQLDQLRVEAAPQPQNERKLQIRELRIRHYIGELLIKMSKWKQARQLFETTRERSHMLGAELNLVQAEKAIGIVHYRRGEYEAAKQQFERACELIQQLDRAMGLEPAATEKKDRLDYEWAEIRGYIGATHARLGDIPAAIQHYLDSLPLYTRLDHQRGIGRIKHRIGMLYQKTHQFDRAMKNYSEARAIFEHNNYIDEQARVLINIGEINYARGLWDDALAVWKQSERVERKIQNRYGLAMVYGLMAQVHIHRGAYQRAKECLDKDLELSEAIDNRVGIAHLYKARGEMQFLKNKNLMAMKNFQRSLDIFSELGDRYEVAHLNGWVGRVALERDIDSARVYIDRARELLENIDDPLTNAEVKKALGLYHLRRASYANAKRLLQESENLLRMLHREFEHARLELAMAQLYLAMGKRAQADRRLEHARSVFEALGAKPYLEMAKKAAGQVIF